MTTRADIVEEARRWIGTPWQHQASLRGVGSDCIGFIVGVALACGLPDARAFKDAPEFRGYGREPDPALIDEGCFRYLKPIAFVDVGLGDVLRFKIENEPRHFGIVSGLDPLYMIHAYSMASANLSRVVEHGLGEVWLGRFDNAFRLYGVD